MEKLRNSDRKKNVEMFIGHFRYHKRLEKIGKNTM